MRPVIYQLFVRHFSNFKQGGQPWGDIAQNGCGSFVDVNDAALESIARLGVTHIWLTGVLRHATRTEYPGIPASPECVVKGKAGSPYAVTDYYDIDPDLAKNSERRMEEFQALLKRCRRWGLIPLIDFVPNHVSRNYRSLVKPECTFGAHDRTDVFFARDNSFYYLEPFGGNRTLLLPEGEYHPERGCGRVSGNNAATWTPGAYDWYETVKLNYGSDYRHGAEAAEALPGILAPKRAVPATWQLMDDILAYWQNMGVGGFRCDMAHMVPMPFWSWIIANARLRDSSVFFMAEAYNDHMKLTPGDVHEALTNAGFRGVYDAPAYHALRRLYEEGSWANDLDAFNRPEKCTFFTGVRYVENHDEPRLASPLHWGASGANVAQALMTLQYTATASPVLIYNGQECSERAEGPGGYGGDNGRTSIFDYTNLPRFQHWTNGGRYDGALMTEEESALRRYMASLLPLLQHPALSKGSFYGLNWANRCTKGYGRCEGESVSGHYLYAFLRHFRPSKSTVIIVCNLSPEREAHTHIHIPEDAVRWAFKKPRRHVFRNLLSPTEAPLIINDDDLKNHGFPIHLPAGKAAVWEWD